MPDACFDHPRLAGIYDAFDGGRTDLDAYLAIVGTLDPARIVDIGCGTGTPALRLARTGRTVIGADPAAASLEVARAKPDSSSVTWLHAGAAELPGVWHGREPADLALMIGNVAQVFRTDDDWAAALRGIRRVTRPGGHLVLESRRPEFRGWEEWVEVNTPTTLEVAGVGAVERRFSLTEVKLPFVTFRYEYRFHADGTILTSDSTLRFRSEDEITTSLAETGFDVLDVREAPDRPGREYVFLTRVAG
ncbi:class I SAM-dependent methyltransferase [Actinoplanes palleronii]|uniref:Methyltransferase n=1 Tax=Actinoplanes palleronii TaxID=113570 RepID=A0ABQ4BTJ6_9ACTN|nr:class I SAM-dependent methyltransferase [Actinoplanes palleronii]GIE74008.1 methyltransferase [Actinoplanes palleronii]